MSKLYDVFPSFPSLNRSSPSPSIRHLLPPSLESIMLLSYPVRPSRPSIHPQPTLYGKGPADAAFVLFCALALTVTREISMRYVLSPFARWWLLRQGPLPPGIKGKKERRRREHVVMRFSEQGWSFLYCTFSWSLGAYILSLLPSPLSPASLWGTYPNTPIPKLTKFYYLGQLGWWFHQIYVLNTEKRRHDHWQMFSHHILTIFLVVGSYMMNFTRVGTVLHVFMDFCDIWLPLAKMFRYLSLLTLCDATFVVFLVSWLITRQFGLAYLIYSAWVDAPALNTYLWDPSSEHYMTAGSLNVFIGMQIVLLGLATAWFFLACRVAVRVLMGQGAEDVRSDGEEEDEDVAVGKDGLHIDLSGSGESSPASMAFSKAGSGSSGVGTPQGVESLGVGGGVHVPEVLKGLQCKREMREEAGARRRR